MKAGSEGAKGTAPGVGTPYRHPWRVAIIAGLASYVDGAALTANGIALVIYQQTIGFTANQIGLLTAVVTFALAIGALVGGRAGDLYGRRKVFIVTMVMIVLGALAPTFGSEFWLLFAGLALLGLGVGADLPVSLATVAEAATEKNRGAMLVFSHAMGIAASLTVLLITASTGSLGELSGRLLYGLILVVGTLGLLLRLTVPESPLWLQAREERRRGVHTIRADKAQLRDLLRPPFRRPFLVLTVFYALTLAASTVTGYSIYIAANIAKIPVADFVPYSLILFPIAFVGLGLFMKFVDGRLRMPLFLIGGALVAVGLLIPVVFGINLITILAALGISAVGQISSGEPIARVWGNEVFPTMLRSTGQGFVFTFGRIFTALVIVVLPAVIAFSPSLAYAGSAVAVVLGVLIGWLGFRGGRIAYEFQHEQEADPEFASATCLRDYEAEPGVPKPASVWAARETGPALRPGRSSITTMSHQVW
jgi:inositol transporter-like SP family MFS transporter